VSVQTLEGGIDVPSRRSVQRFALRFGILFLLTLLPMRALGVVYTGVFRAAANGVLSLVTAATARDLQFEYADSPLSYWTLDLDVVDRQTEKETVLPFDVKASSYRPIATFLALALAVGVAGWRARAFLVGIGTAAMIVITTALISFQAVYVGLGGTTSHAPGLINATICQALTTPSMGLYAIPTLVFWASFRLTTIRFGAAVPVNGSGGAPASPSRGHARRRKRPVRRRH
jgi:hypothetical protein